jgi:hypothetical protein
MKGGWHQGKACKGDGEERQYSKKEIQQMVAEMEEDFLYKYRGKGKPNMKARLEYRIRWCEERLAEHKNREQNDGWRSWFSNWIRSDLEKSRKQLKELLKKTDKTTQPDTSVGSKKND